MPHQPTVTEIRIANIIGCLEPAIILLDELNKAFRTPFLQAISNTTFSLITAVQNAKKNKDECIQLMELVYQVLPAIANLHIKSETPESLPASTMDHLRKFTETIHKIHTFIEAQQEGNRLKNFFHRSEMNSLLKDCHGGLQQALELFKIESGSTTMANIREMQNEAANIHRELLELISNLSDGTASDRASSMYRTLNDSQLSSRSFSMLPGRPQIFHGRDSELNEITQKLVNESARIAILGPGGIGKTSLARAALHHPDVTAKYGDCFFVSCDSALTSIELAAQIGAYIGLKPGKNLTKPVIQYFSRKSTCLLVLDNLETTWEPLASRKSVEEFLSLLTDIDHLALIITMRGTERPAKIRWTRPFLQPLNTLSSEAAIQMFIDIADEFHKAEEVDQLLQLTDNMPLAVDLIAHLVDADGCSSVLSRWETENTSLLSNGHDRRSSLDASIKVSLSSPRLTTLPGAKDLLSVLSILPDGLSDIELQESCLPIPDVFACKVVLLSTALAYIDNTKRLKSLVPIREHMRCFYPPTKSLMEPLCKYFHLLLNLYQKYYGSSEGANRINQLTVNLGNLHQILLRGLLPENADIINAVDCILLLNSFTRRTGRGWHVLMDHVPNVVHQLCDPRTEARFSTELLFSSYLRPILNPEQLISKAIAQFSHFDDPVLKSHFYRGAGYHHVFLGGNTTEGMAFLQRALSLARSAADIIHEERLLIVLADYNWGIGEYSTAIAHTSEAKRLAQLSSNLCDEAKAMGLEARCRRDLGQYKECVVLLHRGRELLKLCGMSGGNLDQYLIGAEQGVHFQKSEYTVARSIAIETRDISSNQDTHHYAGSLLDIAEIDVIIGSHEHVMQNLDEAQKSFSSADIHSLTSCQIVVADLKLTQGDTMTAKTILEKALAWSWRKDAGCSFYCLERMADINRWRSTDFHWTSTYAVIYLAFAHKSQQKLALHKALRCLGDFFVQDGAETTAKNLFIVALEGFTYMDVHRSRADCMLRLGDIAKKQKDLANAVKLWANARPLFEISLQAKDVAQINARLDISERE